MNEGSVRIGERSHDTILYLVSFMLNVHTHHAQELMSSHFDLIYCYFDVRSNVS
jgi:hypothetical protein